MELNKIKLRCSRFKDEIWNQAKLTETESRELNNIKREIKAQEEQVWFRNELNEIGLCEFTLDERSNMSSCGSSYAVFKFIAGKWELENESLTICSSGRY